MSSHATPSIPTKTRDVHNHHQDSTRWNDFKYRNDDIIIATWAKSGTTWTQQILGQLIFSGDPTVPSVEISPWVDLRVIPREAIMAELEAQTHRRYMKTHLPVDAIPWNPEVKYIYVGRDARDVVWSTHHHFTIATEQFYGMLNDTPGRVGPPKTRPPADPRDMFVDLVEDDTRQSICWPYWSHVRGWWAVRDQPNVLLVHFADLKRDLEGEMRRIARFLEIPDLPEDKWNAAVEHCRFDWMKANADVIMPPIMDVAFSGGAKNFINKGVNGHWMESLSEKDNERFTAKARAELGDECARWLHDGRGENNNTE